MTMALLTYSLCALTSLLCAVLLLRGFARTRTRLLLWSGLCFVGLTLSNFVLVLDRIVYPEIDLSVVRLCAAFVGLLLLLFGLVWESE
jgi:Family of unknown function (DUF5985)